MIFNLLNPVLSGAIDATSSDEYLVTLYLESQNTAYFNILYDRYSDKVFAKCISMLKDEMKAEDAVQDVFMKVLLNLSKFKMNARFSTWLYAIAYNFCIDKIRRRQKERDVVADVDDINNYEGYSEDDSDHDIQETNVIQMKQVLERMKVSDKAVLFMKYQDEMSIKEMTEVLDLSESAIKMKIKRAKEKFRKQYSLLYAQ